MWRLRGRGIRDLKKRIRKNREWADTGGRHAGDAGGSERKGPEMPGNYVSSEKEIYRAS